MKKTADTYTEIEKADRKYQSILSKLHAVVARSRKHRLAYEEEGKPALAAACAAEDEIVKVAIQLHWQKLKVERLERSTMMRKEKS